MPIWRNRPTTGFISFWRLWEHLRARRVGRQTCTLFLSKQTSEIFGGSSTLAPWNRHPSGLSWPTGLKNRWLVKRYYIKGVIELLRSMRVAFSRLKNSIWRTSCCFSTGTAILFHFPWMIEITLDSFLIENAVWIDHWLQWLSKKPFWPPYTGET